ncbi:hypothetical protein ACSQ67_003929 [Phaseolus vulgaris]
MRGGRMLLCGEVANSVGAGLVRFLEAGRDHHLAELGDKMGLVGWMEDHETIGKELGFSFSGEKDIVTGRLHAMELRDNLAFKRGSTSGVENNFSDDEDL